MSRRNRVFWSIGLLFFLLVIKLVLVIRDGCEAQKFAEGLEPLYKENLKNETRIKKTVPKVNAFLTKPLINGQLSSDWTAYTNWTYGFSFLISADRKVDLSNNNMLLIADCYRGCKDGELFAVSLYYYLNDQKLPLNRFLEKIFPDLRIDQLERFSTKNQKLKVMVDRHPPKVNPGPSIYIISVGDGKILEVNCDYCSNIEAENLIKSFDFDTNRDETNLWLKYF